MRRSLKAFLTKMKIMKEKKNISFSSRFVSDDRSLNEAAADKILKYRADYNIVSAVFPAHLSSIYAGDR